MGNKTDLACLYARVSTEEQHKEGFSIPAQLKMLRDYGRKQGISIVKEFVDSETARSTGRTGFNALLAYLDKHTECRVILVEKTDRLTRNMADYLALDIEKTGIEIHLVRENKVISRFSSPTAHFMQDIEIAQAAYLSRNISAEAKKGMRAKAEAGLYPSVAPLGYINTKNAKGVRIIEKDDAKAPLIKHIFEEYASGNISLNAIAKEMYSRGLKSRSGLRISTSTIRKMLSNPIYRGKFIWNCIEYRGSHEPIVSSELWFKVQDVRLERSMKKVKVSREFPFTGLMQCGDCGCAVTAESKKDKYTYYHCTGYKGKHSDPYLREEKLDNQFASILQNLQIDREIKKHILDCLEQDAEDKQKSLETMRAKLTSKRNGLDKRSDMLYDDRLDGRITVAKFDEKNTEIRRELEHIEEKLATLDSSSLHNPLSTARNSIELSQKALSQFVKSTGTEKKQILQKVLSNCKLSHGVVIPEFRQPYGILHDTNVAWKASGAKITDQNALHAFWHPKANSNSEIV